MRFGCPLRRLGWIAVLILLPSVAASAMSELRVASPPSSNTTGNGTATVCTDAALAAVSGAKRGGATEDFNDYGILFNAARSGEPECAVEARDKLQRKLTETPLEFWRMFLSGGHVTLIFATALELGGRDIDSPSLDARLLEVARLYRAVYHAADPCGFAGDVWKRGNSCMDDHTLAASGFAWTAAYLRLSGREWRPARAEAMYWIHRSFSTADSICIHDRERYVPGESPCNATVSELGTGDVRLVSINHGNQAIPYGLGLMTSIASAFVALEVAEIPVDPLTELSAGERKIIEGLWIEGQEHTDAFGNFHSDSCYNVDPATSTLTKPWGCNDQRFLEVNPMDRFGVTGYKGVWYPLLSFYQKNEFGRGNPNLYQFDRAEDTFDTGTGRFFGPGRRETYLTLGGTWVTAGNRPPLFAAGDYRVTLGATVPGGGYIRGMVGDISLGDLRKDPSAVLALVDMNGGTLRTGDSVAIRTRDGCFIAARPDGTMFCSEVVDRAHRPDELFILEKTGGTGALLASGDSLALRVSTGPYVRAANGEIVAVTSSERPTVFQFLHADDRETTRSRAVRHD